MIQMPVLKRAVELYYQRAAMEMTSKSKLQCFLKTSRVHQQKSTHQHKTTTSIQSFFAQVRGNQALSIVSSEPKIPTASSTSKPLALGDHSAAPTLGGARKWQQYNLWYGLF